MTLRLTSIALLIAATAPSIAAANAPPSGDGDVSLQYAFTKIELFGSGAIVVLSLFVIFASYFLRKNAGFSEEGVIRLVSLILIVSGTLFLVTLGYSAEQIAPALGILGTIAGYMLGRATKSDDVEKKSKPDKAEG